MMRETTMGSTRDMRSLVSEARERFNAATSATTDKATALRDEGMRLLEDALGSAKDMQESAMQTGRDLVDTADEYVHENPWRTIAISAGVALVLGAVLGPWLTRR